MELMLNDRVDALFPTVDKRFELFEQVRDLIEGYYENLDGLPIASNIEANELRDYLRQFQFDRARPEGNW